MARVTLEGIDKLYANGFHAVQNLSFEVADGEFIVLVGPSGCGKSTTLRMVAGLEEISHGTLKIDGVRVNDQPPKDRGVGMVFQSYALYPHMTAFENIAFGLRLQKLSESVILQRVQTVAQNLEIADLLQRKPKQMSGGQRQRIAMARAIARQPQIFLFDEPLSNLDAQLRGQMRLEIGRLHRTLNTTSLYVTHDQVEAMTLADRIVLLKDGCLQQIGPPLALYDRPANLFVATFMGSPTMNIISAEMNEGKLCNAFMQLDISHMSKLLHTQQKVKIGIRPSQVQLCTSDTTDTHAQLLVEAVEPLGSETLIHGVLVDRDSHSISSTKQSVTVKTSGHSAVQLEELLPIHFPSSALHLFADDHMGTRIDVESE